MITVRSPYKDNPAFKYTIRYLLKEQFGQSFEIIDGPKNQIGEVELFTRNWDDLILPVSHERKESLSIFDGENFDILYFLFLILSRFEETIPGQLDHHERFPLSRSFLSRWNVLRFPIVDEYVDHLGAKLGLSSRSDFKFQLSFDIDTPRNPRLRNPMAFSKGIIRCMLGKETFPRFDFLKDEFFNYPWIMDQVNNEKHNPIMFFISGHTHELDGFYHLKDRSIAWLLSRCERDGYKVGNHGCYGSYQDTGELSKERGALSAVTRKNVTDIRQHFLRFNPETTLLAQEQAGFETDWSMGFAEDVGFRAGTCRPYQPYSFTLKKELRIVEEPLVVMDATLAEKKYQKLSDENEIKEKVRFIFEQVKTRRGHFNILFHNTYLRLPSIKNLFQAVLQW